MVLTNGQLPLYATGASGNQQVYGTIIVGGEEVEPLVIADFVNEIYQVDGENVLVTDMFASTDNGAFDPMVIVNGEGYVGEGAGSLGFAGDALSTALTEGTILIEWGNTSQGEKVLFTLHDETWALEYALTTGAEPLYLTDNISGTAVLADDNSDLPIGIHKLAINATDGVLEGSLDGQAVVSLVAVPWSPAPTQWWLDVYCYAVRSVGVYPAQAAAELPGLSAP